MKRPLPSRSALCILLATCAAGAEDLLVAVAPAATADPGCAASSGPDGAPSVGARISGLSAGIVRALRDGRADAVSDSTLGSLLLALDKPSPDPGDFRRTREHVAAAGAARLVYVNDLRIVRGSPEENSPCVLRFNAALWNAEPFSRRAGTRDSVPLDSESGLAEAAQRVAGWILRER